MPNSESPKEQRRSSKASTSSSASSSRPRPSALTPPLPSTLKAIGDNVEGGGLVARSAMAGKPETDDTDSTLATASERGPPTLVRRSVSFKATREDINDYGLTAGSRQDPRGYSVAGEDGAHSSSVTSGDKASSDDGQGDTGSRSSTEMDKSDAQRQLNQYRERLAGDIVRREMSSRTNKPIPPGLARVSPIQEESAGTSPATSSSEPTTASTESGHTIRGGVTPGLAARTPSYPFPRMVPQQFQNLHHPFTTLSPTTAPLDDRHTSWDSLRLHDRVMSNPSTPASNATFLPAGFTGLSEPHDFPSPNLYEMSLMLSSEPGLDAWWSAVVQIMTEAYKAERVTLAIPADSTDIENVPWGQKATYNSHNEDDLSLGYMARGSSLVPSSTGTSLEMPSQTTGPSLGQQVLARPGIQSRHSFTAYEDKRERTVSSERVSTIRRPAQLSRSKTSYAASSLLRQEGVTGGEGGHPGLNRQALEEHDALEDRQPQLPSWESPFGAQSQGRGKMLNVLQALDYEADPLIDHDGILRVLERGKVIALTRSYPYLDQPGAENMNPSDLKPTDRIPSGETPLSKGKTSKPSKLPSSRPKPQSSEKKKATSLAAQMDENEPRPTTPKYEEYEQAPPSPWAQSPAPSPAVRLDPSENPFFTDAVVDEETFNPSPAPQDYTSMRPPEAIGLDNAWTVLHIPLTHPLLSRPNPAFKLDSTLMDQKSSRAKLGGKGGAGSSQVGQLSPETGPKEKHAPIAILSILSPIIPYPSNLRYSLEHLAPHLATSFSLCRHYTNLEVELNGLQKRRPHTAGFGAIGHDGRPLADAAALASLGYLPTDETASRAASLAGSITSPSDFSGPSRSGGGSGGGTPLWDPSVSLPIFGFSRSSSSPAPVAMGGDSYFNTKPRPAGSPSGGPSSRRNSKESTTPDKRLSLRLPGGIGHSSDSAMLSPGLMDATSGLDAAGRSSDELSYTSVKSPQRQGASKSQKAHQPAPTKEEKGKVATPAPDAVADNSKKPAPTTPASHRHTQLHSYGADFSSTFPSLPPSSVIGAKGVPPQAPSRTGSTSIASSEMTPPSDRLKALILDSLPAHVFVALPGTGEIVWVNSRFLTYRGQTSGDLAADPWGSIHPDDRDDYLRAWAHCVRTGEQFSRSVRLRRFDGAYRWFQVRAVASKDKRGVILQFLGSYMDIHEQHIAELRAARQEEIEASEAKHRLLANLIPQIIFTATEDEGITFGNEQWLSYTGQSFEDCLGLGFMDYVHPEDLAKCRIPHDKPPTPLPRDEPRGHRYTNSASRSTGSFSGQPPGSPDASLRGVHMALSRNNSSSSSSVYELPSANLTELARKGIIKAGTDSSGRLSYTTEIRLRSKSGDYRWHLIRCVEIDNIDFGNGESSYFGSATDINDHKLLEAKLKEAMDSKGRFLSNMSHEIRTPLIGISGMVSFLQDTTLNEEQRDYTNTIQTSANSLLMIINDILDLSKVDAGMMKLNHEWFHTRSLIEDVNELVSTMAIAKHLELNYVVEEDVPSWVKGDKVRIRQVLLNVIGNAIKFTSQGEVFSWCKVLRREGLELEDDEIMLEFSIIDTGRGFTQEESELIFKPFSQIDGSSTRQHGGSGLGLVISRQLVELHGGMMEGSAVPGKGSTFTFTAKFGLPTEEDHPDGPMGLPQPASTESTQPKPVPEDPSQILKQRFSATNITGRTPTGSPASIQTDRSLVSPPASSSSSEPSVYSARSRLTDRSSMSSVHGGLVRFSEAARASGQDLSQMKLDISIGGRNSPRHTTTPNNEPVSGAFGEYRPPMYSILLISPQTHSREATTKHIEMTLPKDVPHQITALASVEEAQSLVGGDDPVIFTHIVVNLPTPEEIIALMDQVMKSSMAGKTTILILSDSVQRQAVQKMVAGTEHEEMLSEKAVTYIYKPVKPSRLAVIFDPAKERDLSIDRNRSTAQRIVEQQKESYLEAEKRMGNKGYKVLVVEDNPVNQKVLQKYLKKVGVEVEVVMDGVECTEKVFSLGHGYYSLILVGPDTAPTDCNHD
jgi:PAS domain S-box-containing protein